MIRAYVEKALKFNLTVHRTGVVASLTHPGMPKKSEQSLAMEVPHRLSMLPVLNGVKRAQIC